MESSLNLPSFYSIKGCRKCYKIERAESGYNSLFLISVTSNFEKSRETSRARFFPSTIDIFLFATEDQFLICEVKKKKNCYLEIHILSSSWRTTCSKLYVCGVNPVGTQIDYVFFGTLLVKSFHENIVENCCRKQVQFECFVPLSKICDIGCSTFHQFSRRMHDNGLIKALGLIIFQRF